MNPIRSIAPKTDHQLYWAFALAVLAIMLAGANSLVAAGIMMVLGLAFFATWRSSSRDHVDDDGLHA